MTLEELQNQIENLKREITLLKSHDHLFVGNKIYFRNLLDFQPYQISICLPDTVAGADASYDAFFIVDNPIEIVSIEECHRTAGTDAGAVTLDIRKLSSGNARDGGVSVLSSVFNLKSTAKVPVRVLRTATAANALLSRGDRLAIYPTGTLTSVNHLVVTVYYQPVGMDI